MAAAEPLNMITSLIIGVFLGFLIGFCAGTRARQILASGKIIGKALTSISFKIPSPAEGDDDADDDKVEEMIGGGIPEIDDFLSHQPTPLDDHPDIDLNPCLMYQIKKYRDQQREEKRIAALAAEGLSEEEIAERLLSGDDITGPGAGGRQNALSLLVSVGARVLPVDTGGNNDNQAVQERRRQMRTVDMYLSRAMSIDTGRDKASATSNKGKPGSSKSESAYDIARRTELTRHGGSSLVRFEGNLRIAKEGRNILRAWKERQKAKGLLDDEQADDSEAEAERQEMGSMKKKARAAGAAGGINAADLALIAMEFEAGGDGFGEEDDDGDAEEDLAA